MRKKFVKYKGNRYTVELSCGWWVTKPKLQIVDSDGNVIYVKKTHNNFNLDFLFDSDIHIKYILDDVYGHNKKLVDTEIHDLDLL